MGLALIELLMTVEERFGIAIPDADAAAMRTVDDCHRFLVDKLALMNQASCQSSALFYQFRRAVMALTGAARGEIRLDSRLESLLPATDRRRTWPRLLQALHLRMPGLERPSWVRWGILLIMGTAFAVALLVNTGNPLLASLIWFVGFLSPLATIPATLPWKNCVPARCASVRDFIPLAVQLNYAALAECTKPWDPPALWEALVAVMAIESGLPPECITSETRLEDLSP